MKDSAEQHRLERNKQLCERLMQLLVNPLTAEQARDLITEGYIQHNPNIPDGREPILNFAATQEGQQAKETMQIAGPAQFVAEGDFVVMIQPVLRPDPCRPGETYTLYWFDMWRIEDGRVAEHWDAAEKLPWSMRETLPAARGKNA
jgi:predicted SnoaL-like aldol condensation-catalyzing enzyme